MLTYGVHMSTWKGQSAVCPAVTEREESIIEAAVRLFLRYGVKRTGMNDIAAEAGIARQTLYNAFANKDDVLRAAIRLFTQQSLAEIAAGLPGRSTLDGKLDLVFEHIALKPYALLNSSPNAEDMVDGMNATSRDEIAASNELFREAIESVLREYEERIRATDMTLAALSDLIQTAAKAAKHRARDQEHLEELLVTLKRMVLHCVV